MMKDKIELKKYYSTKEFLENYIYEENNLGVECTEEGTTFRLWSPQAECISLNLYQTGDGGDAYEQIPMKKEEKIEKVGQSMNLSHFEVLSEKSLYKKRKRRDFASQVEEEN